MNALVRLGPSHAGALLATAIVACAAVAWGRRRGDARGGILFARALALVILACEAVEPFLHLAYDHWHIQHSLPLELCDAAAFAAVVALWRRGPLAFELTWFWGLSGTLQAMLTPAVVQEFPHPEYLRYFVLHGGIVVAALYLGPGLGQVARRGAAVRVFGWTLVYAAAVGVVDWLLDANYFFLCRKPPGSLLDHFGGWPWYIAAGLAIAAALFALLDLPFRHRRQKTVRSTSG